MGFFLTEVVLEFFETGDGVGVVGNFVMVDGEGIDVFGIRPVDISGGFGEAGIFYPGEHN